MENKRERTIKDARAFGLGAAWAIPLTLAVKEFIKSEYQSLRLDLIGISGLVAVLFILTSGRENYNADPDHRKTT